jgi:hypothetical protein
LCAHFDCGTRYVIYTFYGIYRTQTHDARITPVEDASMNHDGDAQDALLLYVIRGQAHKLVHASIFKPQWATVFTLKPRFAIGKATRDTA